MGLEISFYTDEHCAHAVAQGLRRRGVNVLTTAEAGMIGASDEHQLALAIKKNRVIFTQDNDFLKLHVKGVEHKRIFLAVKPEIRKPDTGFRVLGIKRHQF